MKERPILFSGEMVRAILEDRKTQTRRVVKTDMRPMPPDTRMRGFPESPQDVRRCGDYWKCAAPERSGHVSYRVPCPYGIEGDRLWVKETFWLRNDDGVMMFQADNKIWFAPESGARRMGCQPVALPEGEVTKESQRSLGFVLKSPIFMPRNLSRITLEITRVRVQRLQDISELDAHCEGAEIRNEREPSVAYTRRGGYREIWERINGPGSWAKNPWVWAIDFKKL